MGDMVGAHEPHVLHAEELTKKVLLEQGVDPAIHPVWIRNFATSVASLDHKPITEEDFRKLIVENRDAYLAWQAMLNATPGFGGIADVISLC